MITRKWAQHVHSLLFPFYVYWIDIQVTKEKQERKHLGNPQVPIHVWTLAQPSLYALELATASQASLPYRVVVKIKSDRLIYVALISSDWRDAKLQVAEGERISALWLFWSGPSEETVTQVCNMIVGYREKEHHIRNLRIEEVQAKSFPLRVGPRKLQPRPREEGIKTDQRLPYLLLL